MPKNGLVFEFKVGPFSISILILTIYQLVSFSTSNWSRFRLQKTIEPLALQTGQVRKEHYAYEKLGSCSLLAAIEPLTGKRLAQVHPQRTKKEYTLFCQALAASYPDATKIVLVQDNLNTHDISAFYENLPADEARSLAERFEFHFTPKSASWLRNAEKITYSFHTSFFSFL